MQRLVSALFLTLLFHVQSARCDGRGDTTITDPYKYVWDVADEGQTAGMTRFFLDLNDDRSSELFLAANSLMGNGGGPFHIFTKVNGGYREIGVVVINPGGFQLMSDRHHGFHDIKDCSHLNAESCTLVTYVYDGARYQKAADGVVQSETARKEVSATPVRTETTGKELIWKPDRPSSSSEEGSKPESVPHFSTQFDGHVRAGESFRKEIAKNLFFLLEAGKDEAGWTITVRGEKNPTGNFAGITPPFHGPNPTVLYGMDFVDSAPLLSKSVREFTFVANEDDEKETRREIERYTSGQGPLENCEKVCCIFCRPLGYGELRVKEYKVGEKNREKPWLTPLQELRFSVRIEFPSSKKALP